ncbi:MAG: hypothetical protein ACFFC7_16470 [Candidatus Hermodarchaeota archaeon]
MLAPLSQKELSSREEKATLILNKQIHFPSTPKLEATWKENESLKASEELGPAYPIDDTS